MKSKFSYSPVVDDFIIPIMVSTRDKILIIILIVITKGKLEHAVFSLIFSIKSIIG